MKFHKYHALGNDYLVLDPADFPDWTAPTRDQVRTICHRHYGIGSDGILWGPVRSARAPFGLRIFNPDGSEAEKSGNGLRIFCRYLFDRGRVAHEPFLVDTAGGVVEAQVHAGAAAITVAMGRVSFRSPDIPVAGADREVIEEKLTVGGREFTFTAAGIGNPHCVIPLPEIDESLARAYGPIIETHANFPRRTNVQFLQVLDRGNIRLEIWERGAGYTLASGSSSSASAAVAHRLGLVDRDVTVHMPGGRLRIEIGEDYAIRMTGPVTRVADGTLATEMLPR